MGRKPTYDGAEIVRALELRRSGLSWPEVGAATTVPEALLREYQTRPAPHVVAAGWRPLPRPTVHRCPICEANSSRIVLGASYVYLLGQYLGDGHIVRQPKGESYVLRIYQDDHYPALQAEVAEAMRQVLGRGTTRRQLTGCSAITTYSNHLVCLFPQHGVGMKHTRPIQLEPWQSELVARYPKLLVRGLIHSDGCRVLNRVPRGTRPYPRYHFSNASQDIHRIYRDALDLLGVHWTVPKLRDTSVARAKDVAFLDSFVGPKY